MTPSEAVVAKCTHLFYGACAPCLAAALEEAKMLGTQNCRHGQPYTTCAICMLASIPRPTEPSPPSLREQVEQVRKQIEAAYPDAQLGAWMTDPLANILTTFALAQRQAQRREDELIYQHILRVHGVEDGCMNPRDASGCTVGCVCSCHAAKHDPEGA